MTDHDENACTRKRCILRHPDFPVTFAIPKCRKCKTVWVDTGTLDLAAFDALPDDLVVRMADLWKGSARHFRFEVIGDDPIVVRAFEAMFVGCPA